MALLWDVLEVLTGFAAGAIGAIGPKAVVTIMVMSASMWLWRYSASGSTTRTERAHMSILQELLGLMVEVRLQVACEHEATRDSLRFQDMQARIQAVINKVMANGLLTEKMAIRLEAVHAGLAKTSVNLRKEMVEAIDLYLKELKKDVNNQTESTAKTLMGEIAKGVAKGLEKLGCKDKFNEVLREVCKTYDKMIKEHRETRDLLAWVQQEVGQINKSADHLPDRLVILRDKLDEVIHNVDQVRQAVEAMAPANRGDGASGGNSPPPAGGQGQQGPWTPPPQPAPTDPTQGPTLLHLDSQLPMTMPRQMPALTPVTLPDGRVLCIPRSVIAQLVGGGV
ncbi:unnamed protein product [Symbiodinium sp. CCMP2456]|nr:unnamed protein product [Symbiodinium sp. CCMP2456]